MKKIKKLFSFFIFILCFISLKFMYNSFNSVHREFYKPIFGSLIENIGQSIYVENRILVLYAYFEKNDIYKKTLEFFIKIGVDNTTKHKNIDYLFIIQGYDVSVEIPENENIKIFKRSNNCFDFGAYGKAIEWLGGVEYVENKYNIVFFINPSTIGPILPKYLPENFHWTDAFTARLKNDVHIVGASMVCLKPSMPGGWGPRIEGMALAATITAVKNAWENEVFSCHKNKLEAIFKGEYAFTKANLEKGLNIDSLLLQYGPIDWRDKTNWFCNNNTHPARKNTYGLNLTVSPLETVFYKPIWIQDEIEISNAYLFETLTYLNWAKIRKQENKQLDYISLKEI